MPVDEIGSQGGDIDQILKDLGVDDPQDFIAKLQDKGYAIESSGSPAMGEAPPEEKAPKESEDFDEPEEPKEPKEDDDMGAPQGGFEKPMGIDLVMLRKKAAKKAINGGK